MRGKLALSVLIGLLVFLMACGGGTTASPSSNTTSTVNAGSAPVSVTLTDAPPAGVAVLSFEVTINSAALQPGNVALVSKPVRLEITKLETDTAMLNTAGVAPGTYTGISVSFANAELTILNNSGAAIGSCAVGAICELHPSVGTAAVSFTGAPFPLTLSANSPAGLLVDFDLANSIQPSLAINPVITIKQMPAASTTGEMDEVEVVGQVSAKDAANNQFTLTTSGSTPQTLTFKVDSTTRFGDFEDAGLTSGFAAIAVGQVLKVEARLMSGGAMVAKEIEMAEKEAESELEGEITQVGTNQFQMVVVDEEPDVAGVQVGNSITVNIQSGAKFGIEQQNLALSSGLSFASAADLMVGQHVQVRPVGAPSGTPITVTTDRIRLRNARFTARVKAISGNNFTVDNLPAVFTTASPSITEIQVTTSSQTSFGEVSGVSGLAVGNTVSVSGLLFKGTPPTLVAKKVRKR